MMDWTGLSTAANGGPTTTATTCRADPPCRIMVPEYITYGTLYHWLSDYAVVPTLDPTRGSSNDHMSSSSVDEDDAMMIDDSSMASQDDPSKDEVAMACDDDNDDDNTVLYRSTIVIPAPIHGHLCEAFNLPSVPIEEVGQSVILLAFPGQSLCLLPYYSNIDYHRIACRKDTVYWSTLHAARNAPLSVRKPGWSTHEAREVNVLAHLALAYDTLMQPVPLEEPLTSGRRQKRPPESITWSDRGVTKRSRID